MTKSLLCTILGLLGVLPGWHYNLEEAKAIARREHKHILLNFSGSDWIKQWRIGIIRRDNSHGHSC